MIKELRIEEFSPISAVEAKIWEIFDLIRNQVPSNEYDVLLVLVSGFKDDLFSLELLNERKDIKESIINSFYNSDSEQKTQYVKIIDCFRPSLGMIQKDSFKHILIKLGEIDKQVLIENYSDLFDIVLNRIAKSQGKYGGQFIQPIELTRFMCGLADPKSDDRIFNPFAGLASFGVQLGNGQDYLGQELNHRIWAIGALRMMAYERLDNSKYVCDDSIIHWPDPLEKFDLIITNPPMGLRLGQQLNSKTIEEFLVEKSINSLNENGKLIALLPQGFLYRSAQEQRLREYLVEEDLLDTIISLPGGLLLNTGISFIIIVISKGKMMPGKVRFIDAKRYVTENGLKRKVLNDYGLNSFINSGKQNEEVVRIIDLEEIRENGFNLNAPRYFQKKIEGEKLGQVIEFIRGQRGNFPKIGKIVRIKDLMNDKVDFNLDLSTLESEELKTKLNLNRISESCLLLAIRWGTLKPTYFEFKGEPLFKSNDILSFKVNEDKVNKSFLINELHADYVQEQLNSYRLSGAIPSIHLEDLLEIVIKLPSLKEQRAKVDDAVSDKIKYLQTEKVVLAQEKAAEQFTEFASLKHTLGTPRQNILDWTDNLLDFLNRNRKEIEALNNAFAEFYEKDIFSVLKEIKSDVNFITDVLEKGENGLILSKYENQRIPLSEINQEIDKLSDNSFKFKIKKSLLEGEKLEERGIIANKILIKALVDNILINAEKYAFDSFTSGNEVVIELTELDTQLLLQIRNNGKPFPKNFTQEKFIQKYSTSDPVRGNGIGGYDINRIASYFDNSDWILSLNEDPIYLVIFKFQFTIQ